jgi:hypothetical protein
LRLREAAVWDQGTASKQASKKLGSWRKKCEWRMGDRRWPFCGGGIKAASKKKEKEMLMF